MIIHVSGTTGSGKSYLGNFISQLYPKTKLVVIDLDHIYHAILNHPKIEAIENQQSQFAKIKQEVLKHTSEVVKKYKNVLFVGYSDVTVEGEIRRIDIPADHRYFIDIKLEKLVEQYRERERRHILSTRREIKKLSDEEIKKMAKDDITAYSVQKFRRMPQKEIIKEIILLIGK